jgi:hypothetical protein
VLARLRPPPPIFPAHFDRLRSERDTRGESGYLWRLQSVKAQMIARFVQAAALSAGLAGCFTSPTPLIGPEQAEFPVATPTTVDSIRADGTSVPLRLERQGDI